MVERTLGRLRQFRRLRVRYARRADIHEAFLSLGCSIICCRRLTPFLLEALNVPGRLRIVLLYARVRSSAACTCWVPGKADATAPRTPAPPAPPNRVGEPYPLTMSVTLGLRCASTPRATVSFCTTDMDTRMCQSALKNCLCWHIDIILTQIESGFTR